MTNLKALRRRITTPIPATAKGAQGTPLHSLARQPCATSAATGAIGFTHVNGSRFVSAALRREGLAPPLQYINSTLISTFPAWRSATPLLVKKVSLGFFDKLLSELQNQFL
jgi:hypothetical protein